MSGKRGAIGHIEIIVSFIVFFGFIVFLFYVFNPLKRSGISEGSWNIINEAIINNVTMNVLTTTVILNTSDAGYPENLKPCFTLGGRFTGSSGYGIADVVLVNDVSGSMGWRMDSTNDGTNMPVSECWNTTRLYNPGTSRISVLRCLAINFTNSILSIPGNKVGLAAYTTRLWSSHPLSTDNASLINNISRYTEQSTTCICCGINKAYDIINESYNVSRKRYTIVMSDGQANQICSSSCIRATPNGTCGGAGRCLYNGIRSNVNYNCGDDCTSKQYDAPINNSVWSANRTHIELDVSLSSVGIRTRNCYNANQTLIDIARVGGGIYRSGDNASALAEIYQSFAKMIISSSYVEPSLSYIPITGKIVVGNYENNPVSANYSGDISIQYNSSYYNLFFSENFNQTNMDNSECVNLGPENYSMGLMLEQKYIFYDYLSGLANRYYKNYDGLKNSLSIPPGLDFGFIVRDTQGNILLRAINRKSTKVNIYARDVPIQVMDANGKIQNLIINIQVW